MPSSVSIARLQTLPVLSVAVSTDGSTDAVERARTVLELAGPDQTVPTTIGQFSAQSKSESAGYQRLALVVIVVTLPIAGCSHAVSVAAGLSDRKRPFSLLRLTGVPLGMLRGVVALESVVPLLVGAAVAIGAAFVAAQLFRTSQLGYSLEAPDAAYYLVLLTGLVASLLVIASTLPLLRRITGPEVARND